MTSIRCNFLDKNVQFVLLIPVDSIIQKKLGLKVIPCTNMDGEKGKEEYLGIISSAKLKLENSSFSNIVELELKLFERN